MKVYKEIENILFKLGITSEKLMKSVRFYLNIKLLITIFIKHYNTGRRHINNNNTVLHFYTI